MTGAIAPGERRELRAIVRAQFKVLRSQVKRRADEMAAEIEQDLLDRYREEDAAVETARTEIAEITREAMRQIEAVARELKMGHPDLDVKAEMGYRGLGAHNPNKTQLHRAALASIPDRIGDANLALDMQEVALLRQLSEGALEGDEARGFLNTIPSVGQLVPRAVLSQLESKL